MNGTTHKEAKEGKVHPLILSIHEVLISDSSYIAFLIARACIHKNISYLILHP